MTFCDLDPLRPPACVPARYAAPAPLSPPSPALFLPARPASGTPCRQRIQRAGRLRAEELTWRRAHCRAVPAVSAGLAGTPSNRSTTQPTQPGRTSSLRRCSRTRTRARPLPRPRAAQPDCAPLPPWRLPPALTHTSYPPPQREARGPQRLPQRHDHRRRPLRRLHAPHPPGHRRAEAGPGAPRRARRARAWGRRAGRARGARIQRRQRPGRRDEARRRLVSCSHTRRACAFNSCELCPFCVRAAEVSLASARRPGGPSSTTCPGRASWGRSRRSWAPRAAGRSGLIRPSNAARRSFPAASSPCLCVRLSPLNRSHRVPHSSRAEHAAGHPRRGAAHRGAQRPRARVGLRPPRLAANQLRPAPLGRLRGAGRPHPPGPHRRVLLIAAPPSTVHGLSFFSPPH